MKSTINWISCLHLNNELALRKLSVFFFLREIYMILYEKEVIDMAFLWALLIIFCLGVLMVAGLAFGLFKCIAKLLSKIWSWLVK